MLGKLSILMLMYITLGVVVFYLRKASSQLPLFLGNGVMEFKAPKVSTIVGTVSMVISIVPLSFCIWAIYFKYEIGAIVGLFLLTLVFAGLGLVCIAGGELYKVVITSSYISQRTMLNKWKTMPWSDVAYIYFYELNQDFILVSKNSKIRCNVYLIGFDTLAAQIEQHTGKTMQDLLDANPNNKS